MVQTLAVFLDERFIRYSYFCPSAFSRKWARNATARSKRRRLRIALYCRTRSIEKVRIFRRKAKADGIGVPEVIESAERDGEAIVSGSESVDQSGIAQAFNHFDCQKSVCFGFGHNSEVLGPNSEGQFAPDFDHGRSAGGDGDWPVEKIRTFDRDATRLSAYDFHLQKIHFGRTDESGDK